ncbi:MAG: lycopene cyclase domain-containing protein [Actinomycetota bacterium]|nr:MAG: lycopene cyclase domain-containing protein [Actinomycetota bacterium]
MTYTAAAVIAVVAVAAFDLVVARTRLLRRRVFWVSYAIICCFQLIVNGVLTATGTVRYDGAAIVGSTSPAGQRPPLLGDGRVMFAPVEDLLFGFALILLTLVLWVLWGRRGVQRTPYAGPPRSWVIRALGGRRARPVSDRRR